MIGRHPGYAASWIVSFLSLWAATTSITRAEQPSAQPLKQWSEQALPTLLETYRQFHAHPELSLQEEQTAKRLAGLLQEAGYQVTTGVGGHGVVALLQNGEGPTVMLRTDLDALPVTEKTELVYASTQKVTLPDGTQSGVMHACGHDMHMTNVVGTAQFMAEHRDLWQGTLMVIGQPAEEIGAGAKAMLADGLFQRFPQPDFALALHVDSNLPTGTIGYRPGYAMANVDSVDITLKGKGGHGSAPQTTVDPIVQAAQLVIDLQTIVSREISPTDPAVITVGSIRGGTKHNVIGDSCHLQITVRSYSQEVRRHLLSAIERKAKAVATGTRADEPEIRISEGTPSLFNDEKLTARVVEKFNQVLGKDQVVPVDASMGGEDFSRYGIAGVPILMFRLGSVDPKRLERYRQLGQSPPSLHSPLYYPDAEDTLRTGLRATTAALLELLPRKAPGS